MIKVPEVTSLDVAFGNVTWLPAMEEIPEEFKKHAGNRWVTFVTTWFFGGLSYEVIKALQAKEGVDKFKALDAVEACLRSFQPKHEHKTAGCAYLMSEWFE